MKLLVTLGSGNDGPEITIGRHSDVMAETEHATFTQMCDLIEPAIYEAIRQCIRNNIIPTAVVFWDGRRLKIVKQD